VCKFFKRREGSCKFGAQCAFLHVSHPTAEEPNGPDENWNFMASSDGGGRAQDGDASVKLCTAWINTGQCPRMSACKFRHGTCGVAIGKARALWIAERRLRRASMPSTVGDDIPSQDKLGYRARAAVMARWMVETFRKEDLERGVLDVAGGRGDLSFELSMTHSLKCTVVDPRPVRLNKCQHRRISQALASLAQNGTPAEHEAIAGVHRAEDLAEAAQRMQQVLEEAKGLRSQGRAAEAVALLKSFSSRSVDVAGVANAGSAAPGCGVDQAEADEEEEADGLFFQLDPQDDCNNMEEAPNASFEQRDYGFRGREGGGSQSLAQALRACKVSPEGCKCAGFILSQRQDWFGERFAAGGDLGHVTADAGVFCGLHPDEATDHIVKIALAQKKPFCIVPCCVMRTRVPRVGPGGKTVSSYEVPYLLA
jgi:hypothetical protein